VTNSKPTAEIDVLQPNPGCPQRVDEFEGFVEGRDERLDLGELRTDVEIDADDLQRGHRRRLPVKPRRLFVGDAEFGLAQTGRNMRMRARIDVGVDAQGHRRDLAQFRGNLREPLELVFGFHVETQHARLKRGAHFRYALADPGENGFRRAAPYSERSEEHTSELQSRFDLVCRLLLEKKN